MRASSPKLLGDFFSTIDNGRFPIPAILPYFVKTPHMHGAPPSDDTTILDASHEMFTRTCFCKLQHTFLWKAKRRSRAAKRDPRRAKRCPRGAKRGSRGAKRRPRGARRGPRGATRRQRGAKSGPREAKRHPRRAKRAPRRAKRAPR